MAEISTGREVSGTLEAKILAMTRTSLAGVSLALILAVLPGIATGAQGTTVDKSDNVTEIARFDYPGSTEIAFSGKYVYAGQWDGTTDRGETPDQGGVHVIDVSGKKPKEVGFLHCPGNDNDVDVVRPGLIVLGFHSNKCFPLGSGLLVIDVSDPTRPTIVGGIEIPDGVHTMTPFPNSPYVYTSPGGGTGPIGGQTVVDVSNPSKPKVAATFQGTLGQCHDWSFSIVEEDRQLGFCAGGGGNWADGEVSVWDVSDPLDPQLVSQIVNPAMQFPHYALASPDGNLLVVQDENYMLHECYTGKTPLGSIWIYDITNPRLPILVGHADPPRGRDGVGTLLGWVESWCTSHHYNFVPGTRTLVSGWYTGGSNVLDLEDPSNPKEIAHYLPSDAVVWTAQFYRGRIYVSDFIRGLEVIKVKGLKAR